MATPFTVVYESAMMKFEDYGLLQLSQDDREKILERYLLGAQVDFQDICLINLKDRDDLLKRYNQTLDDECIEILATGIAYYWVSSKVLNSEKMKNAMSTKDFSFFSPANLLAQMQQLRDTLRAEFRHKVVEYSYVHSDVSKLGGT